MVSILTYNSLTISILIKLVHLLCIINLNSSVSTCSKIQTIISATNQARRAEFHYGQHFPNGAAAVEHIYGPNGTWKSFTPLKYAWNYYEQYATPGHEFNREALIQAANGSAFYTARDANGYLLCDSDHDLEINPEYCTDGVAFHEHNAIRAQGVQRGSPFTQFWLDDNWLARFMSRTYQRPEPRGLVDQTGFLRWRVIDGDTTNWSPYKWEYFDTLALDGLYYLSVGKVFMALEQWDKSLELSEARWNDTTMRFEYPGVHENYHMGLWKILTEMLLERPEIPPEKINLILQHSVSLRMEIIKNQEIDREGGNYIGWISNIGTDSIINTESVSCCVLGLGANAKFVFEVLNSNQQRLHNQNFAITLNTSERRTKGPGIPLPPANYTIEFLLRARNLNHFYITSTSTIGQVKVVDVTDTDTNEVRMTRTLTHSDFKWVNQWNRVRLELNLDKIMNLDRNTLKRLYDFVVEWDSGVGMEISAVVVK